MSQDDPLNDTFNLDPDHLDEDEDETGPAFPYDDIPEYVTLDHITHMALHCYKEQLKDIQYIPAKHRQRALEVAQTYLGLAKDSISKRDDNELKKAAKALNNPISNENKEPGSTPMIDRRDVYRRLEESEGDADETERDNSTTKGRSGK